jgi:hypothetical protein
MLSMNSSESVLTCQIGFVSLPPLLHQVLHQDVDGPGCTDVGGTNNTNGTVGAVQTVIAKRVSALDGHRPFEHIPADGTTEQRHHLPVVVHRVEKGAFELLDAQAGQLSDPLVLSDPVGLPPVDSPFALEPRQVAGSEVVERDQQLGVLLQDVVHVSLAVRRVPYVTDAVMLHRDGLHRACNHV